MRGFLVLLILLAAIGAGGYYTRPSHGLHRGVASALMAQGAVERPDGAGRYAFEDFYVATHSTMTTGDQRQVLQCWGLFTRFLCIGPAGEAPAEAAQAPA